MDRTMRYRITRVMAKSWFWFFHPALDYYYFPTTCMIEMGISTFCLLWQYYNSLWGQLVLITDMENLWFACFSWSPYVLQSSQLSETPFPSWNEQYLQQASWPAHPESKEERTYFETDNKSLLVPGLMELRKEKRNCSDTRLKKMDSAQETTSYQLTVSLAQAS